jgi:hypothetical protein
LEISKAAHSFGLLFPQLRLYIIFLPKNGLGYFFSKHHLVTLLVIILLFGWWLTAACHRSAKRFSDATSS